MDHWVFFVEYKIMVRKHTDTTSDIIIGKLYLDPIAFDRTGELLRVSASVYMHELPNEHVDEAVCALSTALHIGRNVSGGVGFVHYKVHEPEDPFLWGPQLDDCISNMRAGGWDNFQYTPWEIAQQKALHDMQDELSAVCAKAPAEKTT